MNTTRQPLDPLRLVDAAIAVLKACTDYAQSHDGMSVHPTELVASSRDLRTFTAFEIEEATAFLVRMGYLEPQKKTNGRA